MWLSWLPWKYLIRTVARRKGFIDPIALLARLDSIAQPANTRAPVELLRAGAVLHARGFINNHVIQHNLDWIWPFWVERQFDPAHPAFIPRAFSMTHINITQRNWTAVGYPDCVETPVVDARGLLMPFFDSPSLDGWFVPDEGNPIFPSRLDSVTQTLETGPNLRVVTRSTAGENILVTTAEMLLEHGLPICRYTVSVEGHGAGWLAVSLRPYNPEGVSFVHDIALLPDARGWEIDDKQEVRFGRKPEAHFLSSYAEGDVRALLGSAAPQDRDRVHCDVGMATAAAAYRVTAGERRTVTFDIPLYDVDKAPAPVDYAAEERWSEALEGSAALEGGDEQYRFLYDAAVRTCTLLSPEEVYAGPYTYKRFWYRDAAIILHSMMCAGLRDRVEKALDYCVRHQSANGYFKSQEGEWDSNGQVLWALGRFCRLYGVAPKPAWVKAIRKGVDWIERKRVADGDEPHSGLLPAGFSAEHLGPNDYYYWDDFWTLGGLRLAEEMLRGAGENDAAERARSVEAALARAVDRSLKTAEGRLGTAAMPASPYRRMDSGAIGSVAAGFPLQLWPGRDERVHATAAWLHENCLAQGAFYHDISHSGINAYLTLEIAQCLLRAGDARYEGLVDAIARLASPTGQWPEAIHPQLSTGTMGDGQHAWAAAEWILMMRNRFFFEEDFENVIIVGAGLSPESCGEDGETSFGPGPTRFGMMMVSLRAAGSTCTLEWSLESRGASPEIRIAFSDAGLEVVEKGPGRIVYRKNRENLSA